MSDRESAYDPATDGSTTCAHCYRERERDGLKVADRTNGSTYEHYGWRDVVAALDAAGGATHE